LLQHVLPRAPRRLLSGSWQLPAALQGRALMGWALAIAAGFIALTAAVLWQVHQDIRRDALTSSANLAGVMEREILRTVQVADSAVLGIDETLQRPDLAGMTQEQRRHALFDRIAALRGLGAMMVIDAAGHVVYGNPLSPIDPSLYQRMHIPSRDYFVVHKTGDVSGMWIGRPFRSLISGRPCISLSRRITTPDHHFAGVIVATIDLTFFQAAATQLHLGTAAAVTLLRSDGVVLMREPYEEAEIGVNRGSGALFAQFHASPTGSYESVSPIDGVGRLISYAQVGKLPLLITVAVSEQGVFATWNRRAVEIGGIVLALTAALLVTVRGMLRELAQRRAAEAAARETSARYRQLTESSRDTILRLRLDGTLRYVSPSIEELLGFRPSDLHGAAGASLIDPRDVAVVERAMGRLRSGAEHVSATYRCRRKDGAEVWIESLFRLIRDPQTNAPSEAIASCRDVTQRMRNEAELALSAATDGLTGLANRRRFDEALGLEWRRAHRENTFLALMLLDADCFKAFNDSQGHQAGDAALQMIAHAISATIRRPGDLGARYGGEEFAVLMPNTDEAGALLIAERLRATVAAAGIPHPGGPAGVMTVSIGVAASLVRDGDQAADLLRAADQALYRAKHLGRNQVAAADSVPPAPDAALHAADLHDAALHAADEPELS
jgi:diguanylate cyclase (GGDEF)-like protein/PAS domain S-box-containing protein